jgi:hypothetical protein
MPAFAGMTVWGVERWLAHFILLDCHAAARLAMTAFGVLVPLRRGMPAFAGMTMGVLKDGWLISSFWIATPLRGSQ